ncbi:PAS domain-containing protein [Novosphingobium olei]|nr:PAS domain-containing protein [Novosphingobium olei]
MEGGGASGGEPVFSQFASSSVHPGGGAGSERQDQPPLEADLRRDALDATPDCVKFLSPDGRVMHMNRAGCDALGVSPANGFGMPWLGLLPEDVRPLGEEALRQAAQGENARFLGRSETGVGAVHWDNLLTPLSDSEGRVISIMCVSRDTTAQNRLERGLEEAASRDKLLAREMQHRIKNVFSVFAGLIQLAERQADLSGDPRSATTILREKLAALGRASDAAFAEEPIDPSALDSVDLETLVRSVLLPYGERCQIDGPRTVIAQQLISVFALVLHELATNSVKYGGLKLREGNVVVSWERGEDALQFVWTERGGPEILSSPAGLGFGSQMTDRLVRSIGGRIERTWHPEGLVVELTVPDLLAPSKES